MENVDNSTAEKFKSRSGEKDAALSQNEDDDESVWVPLSSHGGDNNITAAPSSASKFCLPSSSVRQLWSALTFGWFTPVLQRMQLELDMGMSPDLESDPKIPPLPPEDSTDHVFYDEFERLWKQQQQQQTEPPSLVKCLWKAFHPLFVSAGILKAVHDCLQFVGPQVLNGLIRFLREPAESITTGLSLTVAVTVAQLAMSLCLRHYFFRCYRVSIKIRTAVLMAIYQKSLTIDSTYYKDHPIGQITNLMSVDVQRLQGVITYLHAIWYSFLQIVLAMYFLWQQLGPSCLAGVLVILLSIPLTGVSAQWMGKLQKKLMEKKDDRVQCNQETIGNMKIVKLQAWEGPFRDKINHLRKVEIRRLFIYDVGQCLSWLLWSAVPLLIAVCTFGAYVTVAGQSLDVASALTALALFEILRFPLYMLPYVINMIVEASVAVKRIQDFLNAPDYTRPSKLTDGRTGSENGNGNEIPVIRLKEGTFTYENILAPTYANKIPTLEEQLEETEQDLLLVKAKLADAEDHLAELEGRPSYAQYGSTVSTISANHNDNTYDATSESNLRPEKILSLRRVNFECREGEFVAVVGGVGSGKTTLLKAILGECQKVSGEVGVRGSVAYFDQKPFIMNDTVKGNILFGKSEDKVDEELYQLAVKSACLEHDLEMLSFGDQTEIGEKGITLSGGQKARVAMARLVYRDADVVLLDDCLSAVDAHVGRELFDKCIIEVLLLKKKKASNSKRTVVLVTNALQYLNNPKVDRIVVMKNGRIVEEGTYKDLAGNTGSHFKKYLDAFSESMSNDDGRSQHATEPGAKATEEFTAANNISKDQSYSESKTTAADSSGDEQKTSAKLMTDEMAEREVGRVDKEVYFTWAKAAGGLWVVVPLFSVFAAGESMKIFSNWWLTYWSHAATPDPESQLKFLGVYGLINIGAMVADFCRMFVVLYLGLLASKSLFSSLLDSTLMAPMSFFDTTPAGRIMNRFSKDIYTIDEDLPQSFQMQQQAYFSQCYRELKRIDSVTRSPIHALFGETLDGFCTIRAFEAERTLFHRILGFIDKQQHAYFLTQAGLCWLAVRLELIGSAIIFFACGAAVWEKQAMLEGNEVFAGLAGLSISYALSVTQSLNWAVRTGSDFEANMVSVERVRQYTQLDQEAPHHKDTDTQLRDWPSRGTIEFRDSKLRYRPGLPLVLKGLNLTIPSQAKVGVVGRTGAGKSTLMTALMRLVELDSGSILLDGVDIKSVGLTKLRSNIAVIPQDPVLFSGTIKTNLDPFNEHSNDRLLDVLERVGLYSTDTSSTIKSLGDNVMQDGSNYSAGQRQLLVIARALLDGAAVVICDEATASIDAEADARIQRLLRQDFRGATTLTVAHRLNTIMDSTHILVMADGRAMEFDTPAALLSKGGLFKDLVSKWEQEHS
ncbi:multidrug ABC transporter permease/ATPase [Nitzschia inconspicua]|uniref:Multidrug ABC transporter permease/ATPase n=1 Tax=Nitzschia inconspicua TaxID=303405 RepID=A0A9K3LIC8_9STRA|nr:multidrug ABC transporter permease/ATPase [Nitzschia inconspicua]